MTSRLTIIPAYCLMPLWVLAMGAAYVAGSSEVSVAQAGQDQTEAMALPAGFRDGADPERFSPDTLFEIINGDADGYLKAGFVELVTFFPNKHHQLIFGLRGYQQKDTRSRCQTGRTIDYRLQVEIFPTGAYRIADINRFLPARRQRHSARPARSGNSLPGSP